MSFKSIPTREEKDALGSVSVPTSARWGAQTQRCLNNFKIGHERMPAAIIRAYLIVKHACATANAQTNTINQRQADAIIYACEQLMQNDTMDDFPLKIWQTGSGTATNMNVNEVIAHLANQQLHSDTEEKIHPNDHVNCSQSSNDTFPTAMHIAIFSEFHNQFLPALKHLQMVIDSKIKAFANITKIGRTHMQDAVPLTLGQAFSAFASQLSHIESEAQRTFDQLRYLALGGTAVGTGINTPPGFRQLAIETISQLHGTQFLPAGNTFHALSAHTEIIAASASLKNLACTLQKLSNDIRLMSSGPRCGIGEMSLPENEPGSSIMPGKVNPTQCEVVHMITLQVMANDVAIGMSGASGQFELNVCRPLIAYHMLQSLELLADGMRSFADNALSGLQPNLDKIQTHYHNSLMLVTYLTPHMGYTKAAELAHYAHHHKISLREACQALQSMDLDTFDCIIAKSAQPVSFS